MRSAGRHSAGSSDFFRRHGYFLPHLHGWRTVGSGQCAQSLLVILETIRIQVFILFNCRARFEFLIQSEPLSKFYFYFINSLDFCSKHLFFRWWRQAKRERRWWPKTGTQCRAWRRAESRPGKSRRYPIWIRTARRKRNKSLFIPFCWWWTFNRYVFVILLVEIDQTDKCLIKIFSILFSWLFNGFEATIHIC